MESSTTRRQFIQGTSAIAVGALGVAAAETPAVHVGGGETLRVGLIGCGGRGTGAAGDALMADPHTELVAVGDAFVDRAEQCVNDLKGNSNFGSRVKVEPDRVFHGFDNYKKVIDSGVEVILLCTPPHFRPQHLRYAVDAGKHVFVEKPIAVDAPGVRHVQETCKLAESKGLAIVSGLCWRYDLGVRETMRHILDEQKVGDIVAIEANYNTGTLWHRGDDPSWSRMEYQIRNWLYYTWLSGDHILEQAVHTLDKAAWLLGDTSPQSAMAMGGRQQRTAPRYGHIYDHFTVFYEFPDNKHVFFTCRQQNNTSSRNEARVLGTKGQAEILRNRLVTNAGERWRYRGPKPSMYLVEHQEFFKSIRDGKPINNGHYMCNSTMIGVMGRMAAYTGKTLTWEECLSSQERLGPSEYAWTDVPEPAVAIPGQTQFV